MNANRMIEQRRKNQRSLIKPKTGATKLREVFKKPINKDQGESILAKIKIGMDDEFNKIISSTNNGKNQS